MRTSTGKKPLLATGVLTAVVAILLTPVLAEARVTELVITDGESPTFEGLRFAGGVGQYEYVFAFARGELDPSDPLNAGIVNIDKAPQNASGNVEYQVDVTILKPVDLRRGNGRIFYDVVNRGNKRALSSRVNGGPNGNDLRLASDVGTGFLMNEGYTIVWSGWQGDVAPGNTRLLADFPIATNADGTPIVGRSREEFIVSNNVSPFVRSLSYPAADLDPTQATLTVRENETDPRQTPAGLAFRYLNDRQIEITRPTSPVFDGGAIYEFIYPAKDPIVMGMGFAATRDVVSYLRFELSDDAANANPLAPDGTPSVQKALAIGISQSGRFLRDLIYQGFNQDESGRQVFDGAIPVIAGSRKTFTNFEFAQPGRFARQHEDHLFPGDQFPFTYGILTDPISDRSDGILMRCQATGTCPKIMHIDSDTEMWQARGSLVVTDTTGAHITLPDNVRAYLMAGTQHGPAAVINTGICQQLRNPLNYGPHNRALIAALDRWVTEGTPPPDSRYPTVADGTLVPPDQVSTGFPNLPGVTYNGLVNGLRLTDQSVQPPSEGAAYPVFVSKVDADGNGVAGVRHPLLEVPIATHTGWNLRAAGQAENELCSLSGSFIPFADTEVERLAAGDPRPSLEERFGDHEGYAKAVKRAANELRKQEREGFLLNEDRKRIEEEAAQSDVLGGSGKRRRR